MAFITAFEAAAPEVFAAAAPEISTLGAEFGTDAMLSGGAEFGTAGLLGEYATNQGILNALGVGANAAPGAITQANMTADVLGGGAGAGAEGVNAAQVAAEQNAAQQVANSGIQQAPQAAERFANTTNTSFPQTSPEVAQSAMNNPTAQAGSAMNAPYRSYNPVEEQLAQVPGGRLPPGMTGASAPPAEPSGLEAGFNKALNYVKENPFSAGSFGLNALQYANRKEKKGLGPTAEYNGPLSKYKMSSDFQGRQANPEQYQYTPKVYNMAEGGIASYKEGDLVGKSSMDYYERMTKPTAPLSHGDVGIYYDQDPDTRYQDALTAAQIRMAKVNKRANMQTPGMQRPTPMGQLNLAPPGIKSAAAGSSLDPEMAAHGGIMHTSLGGYAAGGNPRLLKGPGDGMSDNIPATIAGKQPARLADGEFVVPADVVSHLGNGSTDAGAKILHEMMDKVRKARTGNPKQGKQINPNKFIPT